MTSGVILLALLVLLLGFLYNLVNAIRLGPLNRRPCRSRLLRRVCLSNESRGLRPRCGSCVRLCLLRCFAGCYDQRDGNANCEQGAFANDLLHRRSWTSQSRPASALSRAEYLDGFRPPERFPKLLKNRGFSFAGRKTNARQASAAWLEYSRSDWRLLYLRGLYLRESIAFRPAPE